MVFSQVTALPWTCAAVTIPQHFPACPQARCLFAQVIHSLVHRKVSQQRPLPGFAGSGRSYPHVLRDTAAARAGWQGSDRAAADGGAARPQPSGPPADQEPVGSSCGRYQTERQPSEAAQ